MITRKIFLTTLLAGTLFSVITLSAKANNYSAHDGSCLFNPGPYAGLDLGWAEFHGGDSSGTSGNMAGGLFLGYDFTPNFATELGYDRLPHDSDMVSLLARLNVPVSNYVSVFGRAGPALAEQPHGSSHVLPEAGAGVAFLPARNTKLQLSYNHVFGHGDIASLHYIALGVAYKFAM